MSYCELKEMVSFLFFVFVERGVRGIELLSVIISRSTSPVFIVSVWEGIESVD